MNGQNEVNVDEAQAWFERSQACFQHAGDDNLLQNALLHSSLRERIILAFDKPWADAKNLFPGLVEACFQKSGGFYIDEAIDICEVILERSPTSDEKLRAKVDAILFDMKALKRANNNAIPSIVLGS